LGSLFIIAVGLAGAIVFASQKVASPTTEAIIVCAIFFVAHFTKSTKLGGATVLFACGVRFSLDLLPAVGNSDKAQVAGYALLWSAWVRQKELN